jgi:hypothetical protein
MRKIVNRKAVPVGADDPASARLQEGPKASGDALNVSKRDVGADRQTSELAVDYAKLGEHVASVVKAAEVAAEGIRAEAEQEAERLRERSEQQAAARVDEANREAGKMLDEAGQLRAEAEEATKTMGERAAAHAQEKRRKAEAEAAKVIEAAKQIERGQEYAAEERLRTLQQNVELTEKRLNQLVGGLREVALQLEGLAETESPSVRSDEGQTSEAEETLDESLRASLGT